MAVTSNTATQVRALLVADTGVSAIVGDAAVFVGRFPGEPELPGVALGITSEEQGHWPLRIEIVHIECYAGDTATESGGKGAEVLHAAVQNALLGPPGQRVAQQDIWRTYGIIHVAQTDTGGPFTDPDGPDKGSWQFYTADFAVTTSAE